MIFTALPWKHFGIESTEGQKASIPAEWSNRFTLRRAFTKRLANFDMSLAGSVTISTV